MSIILNIETSTDVCSTALTRDGVVLEHHECYEAGSHAAKLAPMVESIMKYVNSRSLKLDAVAVSIGPGSYTGLRIGLSTAKGICCGIGVPLIAINTLELLAVGTMFNHFFEEDVAFAPMIDARRMEVYTAVYSPALETLLTPTPLILASDSYAEYLERGKVVFSGNGTAKAQKVISHKNALFVDGIKPVAIDMMALSERAVRQGNFTDIAYSTPLYLKEFQATKPKKLF